MFSFLRTRWQSLFDVGFDVLPYDLASTYFECDPPQSGKRRYGYSRDRRSDCVQVVIALIVTPEGFPLAYEVMNGKTNDSTTLKRFLEKIEHQYGRSERVWVMDRGSPTEYSLAAMRDAGYPVNYLVGTPTGRPNRLEKEFLVKPWTEVRESVLIKLRVVRGRECRYLLRSNMCGEYPAKLWTFYVQLTQIEQAFKKLKPDLSIRSIIHHKDERIEAHIFIAYVAYCLQVTLKQRL